MSSLPDLIYSSVHWSSLSLGSCFINFVNFFIVTPEPDIFNPLLTMFIVYKTEGITD